MPERSTKDNITRKKVLQDKLRDPVTKIASFWKPICVVISRVETLKVRCNSNKKFRLRLKSDTETQLPTHEILATLVATISGWTTDDRYTINRATRRKNSQEVGAIKLIPQQKRNFGKMKELEKGSKAREATVWPTRDNLNQSEKTWPTCLQVSLFLRYFGTTTPAYVSSLSILPKTIYQEVSPYFLPLFSLFSSP
ncbi:hypothetical protein YC2023_072823 [Brassica napus]